MGFKPDPYVVQRIQDATALDSKEKERLINGYTQYLAQLNPNEQKGNTS